MLYIIYVRVSDLFMSILICVYAQILFTSVFMCARMIFFMHVCMHLCIYLWTYILRVRTFSASARVSDRSSGTHSDG
jgi:hypothetical protein